MAALPDTGAPAKCCFVEPLGRGLWSSLDAGAPFLFGMLLMPGFIAFLVVSLVVGLIGAGILSFLQRRSSLPEPKDFQPSAPQDSPRLPPAMGRSGTSEKSSPMNTRRSQVLLMVVALLASVALGFFLYARQNPNVSPQLERPLARQTEHHDAEFMKRIQPLYDSLEKAQAVIEIGVTYSDYRKAVQDVTFEFNRCEASLTTGQRKYMIFHHLKYAREWHKHALESWKTSIEYPSEKHRQDDKDRMQRNWQQASEELSQARALMNKK